MKTVQLIFLLTFGIISAQKIENLFPLKKDSAIAPLVKYSKNSVVKIDSKSDSIKKTLPSYFILVAKPSDSINYLALKAPKRNDSPFLIPNAQKTEPKK